MKSTFETIYMTFCSQARRTCGTTHFIRPCTILHATGIGPPPNFEDCDKCYPLAKLYPIDFNDKSVLII